MDILGQSALIVALTAFTLAITALSRNLRNKLVMTYALLCGALSGWAFFFFLEKVFDIGAFYKMHLVFNLLLAPAGLLFVRVLTRVQTAFLRWLQNIAIIYSTIVVSLEFSAFGDFSIVRSLAFFGPTFLVLACLHLMFIDWRIKRSSAAHKKIPVAGLTRRNWIYFGALLLLGMAAMDHMPWLGDVVPSIGNIFICLYLFVVSEAVIHQRLLHLSGLFTRMLVLIIISLVATFIYTVFVAWIDNSPALFALNTFLASFILILLIDPAKKLVNMGVAQVFARKYALFESKVREAQLQLTGVLDTVGLAQLALHMLETTLRCESATVFILRSDGTKFRRIRGLRDEALQNREILVNHPVVEFFGRMRKRGETPVVLDQYVINEMDRTTSQLQRENYELALKGLQGLNANFAIPLIDDRVVLGFVAVRATNLPEPWGSNWGALSVVYAFFHQAARTLKNMDVYVRLREKDRLAALGEMAAGLAHEIRNPLGAIKGAAQYLQPQSDGPQSAFLGVIIEEVNRLNKVVTQFLDYSRPLASELVQYDIGALLERTHALFLSLDAHDVRIDLTPPPEGFEILPKVFCNPEELKQVLVNFVRNGLQSLHAAPPPGGGVIKLGAFATPRRQDGSQEVVIFVEDNGKGISKENIDKVFIPFFTTSPGGTGLGLSICQRIVEAQGGHIEVISDEGKCTRFSVHLPVSNKAQAYEYDAQSKGSRPR